MEEKEGECLSTLLQILNRERRGKIKSVAQPISRWRVQIYKVRHRSLTIHTILVKSCQFSFSLLNIGLIVQVMSSELGPYSTLVWHFMWHEPCQACPKLSYANILVVVLAQVMHALVPLGGYFTFHKHNQLKRFSSI